MREPCLTRIRCLRNKRTSEQWSCWRHNHPHTPKFNVDWYLGGLSGCEINAHFLRRAGCGTNDNIELRGVGGHFEVGVPRSDVRLFRRHRNQQLPFSESQTPGPTRPEEARPDPEPTRPRTPPRPDPKFDPAQPDRSLARPDPAGPEPGPTPTRPIPPGPKPDPARSPARPPKAASSRQTH